MLADAFDDFRIQEKMVHLMDLAAILLIFMMLSMLVIYIAILRTFHFDKANLIEMMMMKHNRA